MNLRKPQTKAKVLIVYKVLILLFVLVLIFMPKTVTAEPEIEQKLLITTMGIDKTDVGYEVSATAVMPQEGQDGSTMRLTVGAEGESISRALEMLCLKMGKRLELGLCGLIVVGNTFGDESLVPHFSYLLSSGKIIPGAYVLCSLDKKASDVVDLSNKLSAASSNGLSKLIEHNAIGTSMPAVTLLKFLSETGSITHASYLPCIEIEEKKGEGGSGGSSSGSSGSSGGGQNSGNSGTDGQAEIKALNTLVLYRDGVPMGVLDKTATRGYVWTDRRSVQGLVELEEFKVDGRDVGQIYCQLREKKYRLKTKFVNGKPEAHIHITAELELEDRHKLSDLYKYDGVSEKLLTDALVDAFSDKIESEVSAAITALKAVDCDIMLLSDNVYRYNYGQYKKLPEKQDLFKELKVVVHPSVKFK